MPITVVGSIAYDTVKTPFGERERMLGGAAVHFALAASFFDDVRVVGPVGDDFGERQLEVMRARGVDVSDVERVAGGRTFFWQGEYGWDLNSRETIDTQLGVFEGFSPKLSQGSRSSDVLFLANIQPDLQQEVRGQLPQARFVALDSMNLWIDIARDSLVRAIENVDCVILNDAELRQLTGKPNLVSAAREILSWSPSPPSPSAGASLQGARGPSVIVAKQGEYGAALVTRAGFFALPAYPLETVIDPTGAGDTFAGGLVGYIAAHPSEELSDGAAAPRDGPCDGAGVVQRRGVRDRAHRAPERWGDRRAHPGTARDDPVQRRAAAAAGLRPGRRGPRAPRSCVAGYCGSGSRPSTDQACGLVRIGRRVYDRCSDDLDVHLADGHPEDPDRGAVPDRALGRPPDARDGAGAGRRYRPAAAATAPAPPALEAAA